MSLLTSDIPNSGVWKQGGFHRDIPPTYCDNNLFCKTTGREDGPLKEDWGRELRKLTDRQPRSKNDFGFGTKLRFINPFLHALLKSMCVSLTWVSNCSKNREILIKTGRPVESTKKTGDSREKREGWNVCTFFSKTFIRRHHETFIRSKGISFLICMVKGRETMWYVSPHERVLVRFG